MAIGPYFACPTVATADAAGSSTRVGPVPFQYTVPINRAPMAVPWTVESVRASIQHAASIANLRLVVMYRLSNGSVMEASSNPHPVRSGEPIRIDFYERDVMEILNVTFEANVPIQFAHAEAVTCV